MRIETEKVMLEFESESASMMQISVMSDGLCVVSCQVPDPNYITNFVFMVVAQSIEFGHVDQSLQIEAFKILADFIKSLGKFPVFRFCIPVADHEVHEICHEELLLHLGGKKASKDDPLFKDFPAYSWYVFD